MDFDWQNFAALALVAAAAFWLGRRLWRIVFPRSTSAAGCSGGCASCGGSRSQPAVAESVGTERFVPVDVLNGK
jgi:hypothetical protein